MKTSTTLLCILLTFHIQAQISELLSEDWILTSFEINDEIFDAPQFNEVSYASHFTEIDSEINLCNVIYLQYESLTDQTFVLTDFGATLISCPDKPGLDEFEEKFSSLFYTNQDQNFQYNITTDPEHAYLKFLTITNPQGNQAHFFNGALLTKDGDFQQFKIYPNPIRDHINFTNENLQIKKIRIYDSKGRLVLEKSTESKNNMIKFGSFPQGIYYLNFENADRKTFTQKFIKE